MCPGEFIAGLPGLRRRYPLKVFECSGSGFRVRSARKLPVGSSGEVSIELGVSDRSRMKVTVLRLGSHDEHIALIRIDQADLAWRKFVGALSHARTHEELEEATRFI
jgi:hypothetical protein